jgi:plasmid stabilization system protein ParE
MQEPRLQLEWSPEADADLIEVWQYGAERFSPEKADAHLRDIEHFVDRVTMFPLMSDDRAQLRPGLRSVVVYPTVVFFRIRSRSIQIVRVVSGRRNLAALFPRNDSA